MRREDSPPEAVNWRRALLSAAWRGSVLVGLSAGLGLAINQRRPSRVELLRQVSAGACTAPAASSEPTSLGPQQVAELCTRGGTLIADVRSAQAYAQGHVAGAVHLPCEASGQDADHLLRLLDGKSTLVVYGENSGEAARVAQNLIRRAPKSDLEIVVVDGGWKAWQAANLACASGPCDECERLATHAESR